MYYMDSNVAQPVTVRNITNINNNNTNTLIVASHNFTWVSNMEMQKFIAQHSSYSPFTQEILLIAVHALFSNSVIRVNALFLIFCITHTGLTYHTPWTVCSKVDRRLARNPAKINKEVTQL